MRNSKFQKYFSLITPLLTSQVFPLPLNCDNIHHPMSVLVSELNSCSKLTLSDNIRTQQCWANRNNRTHPASRSMEVAMLKTSSCTTNDFSFLTQPIYFIVSHNFSLFLSQVWPTAIFYYSCLSKSTSPFYTHPQANSDSPLPLFSS